MGVSEGDDVGGVADFVFDRLVVEGHVVCCVAGEGALSLHRR